MNNSKRNGHGSPLKLERAGTLHSLVLPRAPGQVRLLVDAACAAYGGMGHMTLDEW